MIIKNSKYKEGDVVWVNVSDDLNMLRGSYIGPAKVVWVNRDGRETYFVIKYPYQVRLPIEVENRFFVHVSEDEMEAIK